MTTIKQRHAPPRMNHRSAFEALEIKASIQRCALMILAGFSAVMLLAAWWR